MKKLIVIPFILLTLSLFAAPIGEKRAKEIALNFFASSNTRASSVVLSLEWAGSDVEEIGVINSATRSSDSEVEGMDDALVYIYNRMDKRSFVVVAGDDSVERAIIAFSHSNTFDTKDMPDGAKAMLQAWCEQIAAARNSKAPKVTSTRAETGVGNVVCQYETALWGQGAPYNTHSPMYDGDKTPSGCVATAMAILCYYHKWPEKGVGTTPEYTYKDDLGVSRTIPANELGRTYDYSLMLSDYSNGYTEEQGLQVANLMYDLGTSVSMKYGQDGSSASSFTATSAMVKYFGYSKGAIHVSHNGYTEEEWTIMLKNNIKEYGPTRFGGSSDSSGHSFILDGFTDANYFSINYGWGGNSNGYYLLPNISYYKNQAAGIGLIPDRDGTSKYRDYLTLTSFKGSSGRTYYGLVSDATYYEIGEPFSITLGVRNSGLGEFLGKYMVAHCDKEDNIKTTIYTNNRSSNPILSSKSNGSASSSRKLSKSIAVGDCLRVFYRGSDDEEWILARRNSTKAYDKVLLCATPQEVAQSLNLEYDKESKSLSFLSEHAIQYVIKDASGGVVTSNKVASHTTELIYLGALKSGVYTCSFASGGEPYELTLKL